MATGDARAGQFKSFTDAAGNVVTAHYDSANAYRLDYVTRTGGGVTETLSYTYVSGGDNDGRIASVALDRGAAALRTAEYSYFTNSDTYGKAGDLKLVTIKEGSDILGRTHYRYTASGRLLLVLGPRSYARANAELGDPLTQATTALDDYADLYFTYDNWGRVATQAVQGAGCSSCGGGLGTFSFEYFARTADLSGTSDGNPNAIDFNTWRARTIETLPDGNQNVVYMNEIGQVVLRVRRELLAGQSASLTRSGTTATATVTGHGYSSGDVVVVSGASLPEYNGTFVVTVTGADTLTYI